MKAPTSTVALGCVNVALAAFTAAVFWMPLRLEREIHGHAVALTVPARLAEVAQPEPPSLAALRTAPLFYRTRELVRVEDPAALAASRPQYILVAALMAPSGKSVAYLRPTNGKDAVRVRVGDGLGGWVIKTIELRRVVAARSGETTEILPAPRPASVGLTRVSTTAVAAIPSGSRVLAGRGVSPTQVSGATRLLREARTYRAPPTFPVASSPKP